MDSMTGCECRRLLPRSARVGITSLSANDLHDRRRGTTLDPLNHHLEPAVPPNQREAARAKSQRGALPGAEGWPAPP